MTNNNFHDVTPDDFNGFEDVPTYAEGGSTSRIRPANTSDMYQRTGKTAPTEVFPSSISQPTEMIEPDYAAMPAPVAEPAYIEPAYVEEPVATAVDARRGTIDLGLLLLRFVLGGYLIFSAIQTFFQLGSSQGIAGLEAQFGAYAYGNALAVIVPTLELAAGVFIVLGLLSPVASMVAIAVTGFMAAHTAANTGTGFNPVAWGADVWLAVILLGVALAHQFTGPGFYAVDSGRGWARRPLASSWIFAALGIAAAALMWWFGTGINPFA